MILIAEILPLSSNNQQPPPPMKIRSEANVPVHCRFFVSPVKAL